MASTIVAVWLMPCVWWCMWCVCEWGDGVGGGGCGMVWSTHSTPWCLSMAFCTITSLTACQHPYSPFHQHTSFHTHMSVSHSLWTSGCVCGSETQEMLNLTINDPFFPSLLKHSLWLDAIPQASSPLWRLWFASCKHSILWIQNR
jgi:hypothetical protein